MNGDDLSNSLVLLKSIYLTKTVHKIIMIVSSLLAERVVGLDKKIIDRVIIVDSTQKPDLLKKLFSLSEYTKIFYIAPHCLVSEACFKRKMDD